MPTYETTVRCDYCDQEYSFETDSDWTVGAHDYAVNSGRSCPHCGRTDSCDIVSSIPEAEA